MKRVLIFAGVLALWANAASAAIFIGQPSIAFQGGGIWDWTYEVTLQPDQTMREGDFATIYDVPNIAPLGGFNPIFGQSVQVVGPRTFAVTTQNLGVTPGVPPGPDLPSDDPGIANVTVRLTGGGAIEGVPSQGPITIGTLHIKSTTDQAIRTDYITLAGITTSGNDSITSGSTFVAVPEPGSLTLMVVGLLAAGGLAFRRRQI